MPILPSLAPSASARGHPVREAWTTLAGIGMVGLARQNEPAHRAARDAETNGRPSTGRIGIQSRLIDAREFLLATPMLVGRGAESTNSVHPEGTLLESVPPGVTT